MSHGFPVTQWDFLVQQMSGKPDLEGLSKYPRFQSEASRHYRGQSGAFSSDFVVSNNTTHQLPLDFFFFFHSQTWLLPFALPLGQRPAMSGQILSPRTGIWFRAFRNTNLAFLLIAWFFFFRRCHFSLEMMRVIFLKHAAATLLHRATSFKILPKYLHVYRSGPHSGFATYFAALQFKTSVGYAAIWNQRYIAVYILKNVHVLGPTVCVAVCSFGQTVITTLHKRLFVISLQHKQQVLKSWNIWDV